MKRPMHPGLRLFLLWSFSPPRPRTPGEAILRDPVPVPERCLSPKPRSKGSREGAAPGLAAVGRSGDLRSRACTSPSLELFAAATRDAGAKRSWGWNRCLSPKPSVRVHGGRLAGLPEVDAPAAGVVGQVAVVELEAPGPRVDALRPAPAPGVDRRRAPCRARRSRRASSRARTTRDSSGSCDGRPRCAGARRTTRRWCRPRPSTVPATTASPRRTRVSDMWA